MEHGTRLAKVIQVICVVSTRGKGVWPDAFREVVSYWTLDGELLAEVDSAKEDTAYDRATGTGQDLRRDTEAGD